LSLSTKLCWMQASELFASAAASCPPRQPTRCVGILPWTDPFRNTTFIYQPSLPGNPNIYNSIVPDARVRDIIPRVRRSYQACVLPNYFHCAPHLQHFRTLVTRACQDPMLLRYPPESPWVFNHFSIALRRTPILAHGYCTRIAQGFVGPVRAAPRIIRDDGRENFL